MIRRNSDMICEVREHMRGGEGCVTIKHIFKTDDFTAKVRLCAQLTIPAGAGIGLHEHAGEDEVYFITGGAGLLDDGKTKTRVTAGDAVLTGNGQSHAVLNDGDIPLEITAFIACYPDRERS